MPYSLSNNHAWCQINCISRIGQTAPDKELGQLALKQRIKLLFKRILPAETKRYLKRKAHAMRERIGQSTQARSAPLSLSKESGPAFQSGQIVRIRPKEQIMATLNSWGELKGCGFMPGMELYCGTTQRVLKPLRRFIDERDYRVKKAKGVYILEGLVCQGQEPYGNCDRSCFFFWREEWMMKVD